MLGLTKKRSGRQLFNVAATRKVAVATGFGGIRLVNGSRLVPVDRSESWHLKPRLCFSWYAGLHHLDRTPMLLSTCTFKASFSSNHPNEMVRELFRHFCVLIKKLGILQMTHLSVACGVLHLAVIQRRAPLKQTT